MKKNRIVMVAAAMAMLVPVLILTGCTPAAPAVAPNITVGSQQEGIWVSGQGEVKAVPDVANITLGVQAQAPTVAEAQEKARQVMDAVMAALKNSGIAEKDIQTTGYNIWQQTRWDNEKQEEIVTGYRYPIPSRSRFVRSTAPEPSGCGPCGRWRLHPGAGHLLRGRDRPHTLTRRAPRQLPRRRRRREQLRRLAGVNLGSDLHH